ncbi:lactadherin [Nematostella vectensis]|uniref:lactadherin n=1 Tax=Nematostella vectensis TaxID=45351 RepID=UPI0013900AB8|nr:lactadherin [Nematostella vectensis]
MKSVALFASAIACILFLVFVQNITKGENLALGLQREFDFEFGNLIEHNASYLTDARVVRSLVVESGLACLFECLWNKECFSVNVEAGICNSSNSSSGQRCWCEHLSTDRRSLNFDKLQKNLKSLHYEFKSPCDVTQCPIDRRCRPSHHNNSYTCVPCDHLYMGKDCTEKTFALGMETGAIPNAQIRASSKTVYYDANFARLMRQGLYYSCWQAASFDLQPWLEIDLGRLMIVSQVGTQGRPHYGFFVRQYAIKYSLDGTAWTVYQEGGVDKVFNANLNNNIIVYNRFTPALRAKFIRFYPKTWSYICALRVELYGKGII